MAAPTSSTFSELSFGSLISQSWEIFKKNWKLLGVIALVVFAINVVGNSITTNLRNNAPGLGSLFSLGITILSIFISMGWINVLLKVVRTGSATYQDMYNLQDKFWNYLLGTLYSGLIVMLGFLLLIVPGIIWSIKYMFVPYVIVDKNLTATKALEASANMTNGIKWKLFSYWLGFVLLNILGAVLAGVGLIITVPLTTISAVLIYESLQEKA